MFGNQANTAERWRGYTTMRVPFVMYNGKMVPLRGGKVGKGLKVKSRRRFFLETNLPDLRDEVSRHKVHFQRPNFKEYISVSFQKEQ